MAENKVVYDLSLNDHLSGKLKEAEHNAGALEHKMGGVNEAIKKVGEAIAVAFAVEKIVEFVKESLEATHKLHEAEAQLSNTMKNMGTYSKEAFEKSVEGAKELSSHLKYTISDFVTLKSQLGLVGNMGQTEMQRMSAVAADIATKKGMGLLEAGDLLAKAINAPEMARRLGMALKIDPAVMKHIQDIAKGGHEAQARMELLAVAESKVGGAAQAAFDIDPLARFDKSIETIKLKVGDVAVNFQKMLAPAMEWLANKGMVIIDNLTTAFSGFGTKIYDFFQPLFAPMQNLFNTVWNGIKKVWAALSQFGGEGGGILKGIQTALGYLIEYFTWLYDTMFNATAAIIDVFHTIYVLLEKLYIITAIKVLFEGLWFAIKKLGEGIVWLYDHSIKPILDAIGWAYDKIKGILGIKEVKVSGKVTTATETTPMTDVGGLTDKAKKGAIPDMAAGKGKSEASKVTGSKSTTINIHIGKLIESFKVQTNNMQEGSGRVKELVAQSLLSAINDSQVVAGI